MDSASESTLTAHTAVSPDATAGAVGATGEREGGAAAPAPAAREGATTGEREKAAVPTRAPASGPAEAARAVPIPCECGGTGGALDHSPLRREGGTPGAAAAAGEGRGEACAAERTL